MSEPVKIALDFIDRARNFKRPAEFRSEFSLLLHEFGFTHFIMTGLPATGDNVERLIVANAWPDGWTDRYSEQGFLWDDPVTQWSLSQVEAFTWQEARNANPITRRTFQIEHEAMEFGLVDGIGCPTPLRPHMHSVVSLASDQKIDLPRSVIATLQIAAGVAHRGMAPSDSLSYPARRLTQREKDILRWAALGRTRSDIATILGISDGTVKTHVNNILTKLDALNSTHAVVIAMQANEIRL